LRQAKNIFLAVSIIAVAAAQPVYNPPSWAKSAIWYQIFPERFRNGDVTNDPTPDDMVGAWPYKVSSDWKINPWNSDWYKLQPWEEKTGKKFYDIFAQRRYGGDLQGIIDELDYLQQLGINAIYINPIFESPSLHKYDAAFYHHIDNNFGPEPKKDRELWNQENPADPSTWKWTTADQLFLNLISQAHKRGMKIIIDGVFNHTGTEFWAFKDIRKNGKNSPYVSWYTIKRFDDTSTVADEFDYEGWYGVKDLPEIREDENGLVTGPREHIHAVVKRWMDPNNDGNPSDGIDGWRLDVASQVDIKFWKEFRRWTREINSESYLVGEVWWEDWMNNAMYNPAPWIADGTVFDAVMNYRLTAPILNYFTDKKNKITSSEFAKRIDALTNQFPPDVTQAQMNTLDSHDTDRLPSIIVNPDRWFDHAASAKDDSHYNVRKPNEEERAIQKLALLFQFTTLGAPTIYYGDEAGMWGGDDPDERKPMVWKEISFEPETTHPLGKKRPADEVSFDEGLFGYYRKLISIRKYHSELAYGSSAFVKLDDANDVIAYSREYNGKHIIVCINNSTKMQKISLAQKLLDNQAGVKDLLTNMKITAKKSLFELTLKPKSGMILKGDKSSRRE